MKEQPVAARLLTGHTCPSNSSRPSGQIGCLVELSYKERLVSDQYLCDDLL